MASKSYRIDSALLIEEVRKRPLLYDAKLGLNQSKNKKEAWDDIADALFGAEFFADLSADEKEGLIKEMQVKWKSLRDNFTRVLRKEKEDIINGVPEAKRKRYIYFEKLMFLAPHCKGSRSSSSSNPNVIYLEENKDSNDDSNSMFNTTGSEENNPLYSMDFYDIPESHGGRSEEEQKKEVQESASASSGGGAAGTSAIDGATSARIARVLEELARIERDDKADDPMGNRKFLQSLLPFMKKLPDDVNLEVRLQIMGVLQTYLNNKIIL